ncbi:MAG: hypothetical protein AABW92_02780 [Nanoarchaeota archaeon]
MTILNILNSREKKNINKLLKEQFGFSEKLKYEFFMNPKNRIFLLNKDAAKIDMDQLRVNSLGLYFGEINNGELRLSIEGSQLIGNKSKKNILKLNDEEASKWMAGEDFDINSKLSGFVIVKNDDDFLGCGRVAGNKLLNYVPKERRE